MTGNTFYPLKSADCPRCGGGPVISNGEEEWCDNCDWRGDIVKEHD